MYARFKYDIALLVALVVFIICKLPALTMPYFWDELGVYAQGALYMHDHGPGLLPAALPPELSRGHPLLFYFVHAVAFSIFGDSVLTAHITALFLSVCLLVSLYYFGVHYFDAKTGLIAVLLLMVQPLFFAQSVLVLPEIFLTLLMLWSLHWWTQKNYLLYGLFASAAIMTKETAIIIPVVLLVTEFVMYAWKGRTGERFRLRRRHASMVIPFLVYAVFLMIQKQQNGWYLFPLHDENIGFTTEKFELFMHDYLSFIFLEQGRIVMTVMGVGMLCMLLIGKALKINRFSVCMGILILGGLSFNSLNFYMNRYMVFVLVAAVFLFAVMLHLAIKIYLPVLLALPVIIAMNCYSINGKHFLFGGAETDSLESRFTYDEDMAYLQYLDIEQQAVHFIEMHAQPADSIYTNFPMGFSLTDPRHGFTQRVNHTDFILQPHRPYQRGFKYAVIIDPGSYDHRLPAGDSIKIAAKFENAVAHVVVYSENY